MWCHNVLTIYTVCRFGWPTCTLKILPWLILSDSPSQKRWRSETSSCVQQHVFHVVTIWPFFDLQRLGVPVDWDAVTPLIPQPIYAEVAAIMRFWLPHWSIKIMSYQPRVKTCHQHINETMPEITENVKLRLSSGSRSLSYSRSFIGLAIPEMLEDGCLSDVESAFRDWDNKWGWIGTLKRNSWEAIVIGQT